MGSANENIQALQRTVKQQEKELLEKNDQSAALLRNYETLVRIRQADQKEFAMLKTQQTSEREELQLLRTKLDEHRERITLLEVELQQSAAADSEAKKLELSLADMTRERDSLQAALTRSERHASELAEANKSLKMNLDKISRAHHEALQRSRKSEEALRVLEAEKEAAETARQAALAKVSVQERQLKTFLEANDALETDLRKQLERVAVLDRRKVELEAEQSTVEAYYQARLGETQAQYDRLLADQPGQAS